MLHVHLINEFKNGGTDLKLVLIWGVPVKKNTLYDKNEDDTKDEIKKNVSDGSGDKYEL